MYERTDDADGIQAMVAIEPLVFRGDHCPDQMRWIVLYGISGVHGTAPVSEDLTVAIEEGDAVLLLYVPDVIRLLPVGHGGQQ